MANIANRSPWLVTAPGKEPQKFRLKSKAKSYIEDNKLTRAKMQQLETAFEVQIKLKDGDGNIVTRSATHDSLAQAEAWAKEEEGKILAFKKANGSFDLSYENMTLATALRRFHGEHYKGKASFDENGYRVEHIIDWLDGEKVLLKDVTKKGMMRFLDMLKAVPYSASSIKNYFTVMNSLFKHAIGKWLYPIENPVNGIPLPKPDNAIERYWEGDEEVRLRASMRKNRPWLEDIVDMSLQMSFRRGELVSGAKDKETGKQAVGMVWEGINFEKNTVRLFKEKNDWKKSNTELKGRTVPMSPKMKEILQRHYEKHPTKKGPVFLTYRLNGDHTPMTINTVSHAFTQVCKLAEPPIEGLTFHTCRKIATVDIANRVPNAIYLSKITGHRSINVLAQRYFAVPMEELQRLLNIGGDQTVFERGMYILEKHLSKKEVAEFFIEVSKLGKVNEKPVYKDELEVVEVQKTTAVHVEEESTPTINDENVADAIIQTWSK
jgi:integrase